MSEDLISRLRSHRSDKGLWAAFYAKLRPAVYFAAYRRLHGNRALAEDVTHDAFLRFIRYANLDALEDDDHALAYLRQTARHLCWDRLRHDKKLVSLESHEAQEALETWGADEGERSALRLDVERLGRDLSPSDQELLTALIEGIDLKQIAQRLDITYGAAAVRVSRLRDRLFHKINDL
jgi:RNA polymerase sigma factor (sigma-70 family)